MSGRHGAPHRRIAVLPVLAGQQHRFRPKPDNKPVITHAEGKAPQQLASIDVAASRSVAPASKKVWDEDSLEEDSINESDIDQTQW